MYLPFAPLKELYITISHLIPKELNNKSIYHLIFSREIFNSGF
ncbi:MAG: hypothetical protein BAJALOKI3v1_230023 [Promethearchaeota archaeon]|nr:MAG: hypothetical protein BAJALOKI3v1_230023 [Candidatus Lokiarchaeota archaeon]